MTFLTALLLIAADAGAQPTKSQAAQDAESPTYYVPILSAVICDARDDAREARKDIAEQKSLAKRSGGGVVDLRQIYLDQQEIRRAEEREKEARRRLAAAKRKPLSCAILAVQQLAGCLDSPLNVERDEGDICTDKTMQKWLKVYSAMDGDDD